VALSEEGKMKYILGATAIGLLILVFGYAGQCDMELELQREKQYCKMVQVWMSDKALGIPPEQRRGWPPYDSSVFCEW
jgi:hypothetical protein|tara:strand:+ start:870 stop:1103 length:234 start_codon:yes stop_codon:yes gene_type:complete